MSKQLLDQRYEAEFEGYLQYTANAIKSIVKPYLHPSLLLIEKINK
jgi:hypothetical protein